MTTAARYQTIVDALVGEPGVSVGSQDAARPKKGFGSSALRVHNRIFAMLSSDGSFVVKLPRGRVDSIIASRHGERFDAGRGRLMKDWVSLEPTIADQWLHLAKEAVQFVSRHAHG